MEVPEVTDALVQRADAGARQASYAALALVQSSSDFSPVHCWEPSYWALAPCTCATSVHSRVTSVLHFSWWLCW